LANERQVNFCIETAPSCISAVDPEKLQRVVMNLLSNAFKFVPNGGTVRFRLDTSEGELVLMVEDSGPGVKPEMRHLILSVFGKAMAQQTGNLPGRAWVWLSHMNLWRCTKEP
jgi:signal transduction histidine kinase